MGVSIATFGASFRKYLPGVVKTINSTSNMSKIGISDMKWEGERLLKTLHFAFNTALGNITDGGGMPTADQQYYAMTECFRKFLVGAVQVTDGIMKNAATTSGAAINYMDSELRGMMEAIKFYKGFMLPRNGTGVVALLGTVTNGATITVNDGRGLIPRGWYEIRAGSNRGAIVVGDLLGTFRVASKARALTGAGEATITPTAVVPNNLQIATDFIVWGAGAWSSYGRATNGFQNMIDNTAGTFQGLSTITYPQWTSPTFNGGGLPQNVTSLLFRQVQATVKQETPEGEIPNGWVVYTSVWDGLNVDMLFEHNMRLTPDSKAVGITGGMNFQSALGKFTVLTDPWCPYGEMYFINPSAIHRPVQQELDWRPGGTSGIFNRSDQIMGYTASCLEISDLFILERSSCAKITNLVNSPQSSY